MSGNDQHRLAAARRAANVTEIACAAERRKRVNAENALQLARALLLEAAHLLLEVPTDAVDCTRRRAELADQIHGYLDRSGGA